MNSLVWRAFLLLLVLLPLPFGGFRPWAWSIAGLLTALLLLVWFASVLSGRRALFWRPGLWPPIIAFFLVLAWSLVQAWLPVGQTLAHPLWQLAGEALGQTLSGRISAAPQSSLPLTLRYLTYAGFFWIALQYGREREGAQMLLRWLAAAGALYAAYGLINFLAGNDYLLWYRRWAYVDSVTGTFVNRNSYATYAGLGLLALLLLSTEAFRRRWRLTDPSLSWIGRRVEALSGRSTLYLVAAIIVAMALLQTHSRMGFVASALGVGGLLALLRITGGMRGWGVPVSLAAIAALVLVASGTRTFDRFEDVGDNGRSALIETTQQGIASAPLLGSGFGSFASVFPMYRDPVTLPLNVEYPMAHSSYLELAMEIGIPAAVLLCGALLWLTGLCLRGVFTRTRDQGLPAIGVAASVLVGFHSLLDFSIQIEAVGCTFMAILGMAVAQSYGHSPVRRR